jgi:hypothetical protein
MVNSEIEYLEALRRIMDEYHRLEEIRSRLTRSGLTDTEINTAIELTESLKLELEEKADAYGRDLFHKR